MTSIKGHAFLLAAGLVFAASALAQDHPNAQRGDSAQAYELGQIDAINVYNGNLTLAIPLGLRYPVGGALSYGLTLRYNGQLWDKRSGGSGETVFDPNPNTNVGLGWQLSLGRVHPPFDFPFNKTNAWSVIEGDGSKRDFYSTLHFNQANETAVTGVFYSRDSSYLRLTCRNGTSIVDCNNTTTNREIWIESGDGSKRVFAGRNPNSSGVPGSLLYTLGQLVSIQDAFGNFVNVVYFSDRWELRDQHGRIHQVFFAPCNQTPRTCVTQVRLRAFGGAEAVYGFNYLLDVTLWPGTTSQANYHLLSSVVLPDGSTFAMTYKPSGSPFGEEGTIASVTLPTSGRYEYDYGVYVFRTPGLLSSSVGVAAKRAKSRSGVLLGTWTYAQAAADSTSTARVLTDPEGNVTRSYFGDLPFEDMRHGLPMHSSLCDTPTCSATSRFLSTEVFDVFGVKQRSTYLKYTADTRDSINVAGQNQWGNLRVESNRTTYHDDGGRFADVNSSDFDGLGHYRTSQSDGNFGSGDIRTESMTVNFGSDYDCLTPGSPCNGFVQVPGTGSAWLLGNVVEARQQEGAQTFTQQSCFDSQGFKTRERALVSGITPSLTDVLRVFTHDGLGNLLTEEHYGGDPGGVGTQTICSASLPVAQYKLAHSYSFGARSRTAYMSGAVETLVTLDATIDSGTGLASSTRDTAGVQTTYLYDTLGRVTQTSPADVAREEIAYTTSVGSTQAKAIITRKEGSTTRALHERWFDDFGRLERERKSKPNSTVTGRQRTYNAMGWLKTVSEWGTTSFKTTYSNFDAFGRARQVQAADGSIVTLSYTGVSQVSRTTSIDDSPPKSSTRTERFDRQGRLYQVTEPSNNDFDFTTSYTYDAGGRLKLVTQGVQTREFEYDGRGFLIRERHPEKIHPTDPTWDVLYSNYDALGHARQRDDAGRIVTYTFDAAERLTEVRRQPSNTILKQYVFATANNGTDKAQGKLRTALRNNYVRWNGTSSINTVTVVEYYEYRGKGGRVDRRDTQVDWVDGVSQTQKFAEGFTYTTLGDIDLLTYPCVATGSNPFPCVSAGSDPAPQRILDYNYGSSNGFLTAVVGTVPAATYAQSISYHNNLELARVDFAGFFGAYHRNMDPNFMARPASIGADFYPFGPPPNSVNPVTLSMTYDGSGNVVVRGGDTYDYDKANRIKRMRMGNAYQQDFIYDQYGNLTTVTSLQDYNFDGTVAETSNRTFSYSTATNRLSQVNDTLQPPSQTIQYNNPGDVTRYGNTVYEWDDAGTMTQLKLDVGGNTNGFRYLYTADEERLAVRKWNGTQIQTSWFLRDLGGQVLREYLYLNSTKTWTRDYTYQNGLMLTVERPAGTLWPILDHLGTPVVYQDANHAGSLMGSFLFPYGEDQITKNPSDIGSPKRFTGHERDQNLSLADFKDDLDYMHARYYSPHLGRFLSVDPVNSAELRAPQSWSKYTYVTGNPLRFVDPTGEYGRGSGFTNEQWTRFDRAQQWAATSMERRADKLEAKADKVASGGNPGKAAELRTSAGYLSDGAAVLRSNGSDGNIANAVNQTVYLSQGGNPHGAAFTNGAVVTINIDHPVWMLRTVEPQRVIGHESLHTIGLSDQRGPNNEKAYKNGLPAQQDAFRALRGTPKALINPDHIMDLVY